MGARSYEPSARAIPDVAVIMVKIEPAARPPVDVKNRAAPLSCHIVKNGLEPASPLIS
jgi:hypothetical protein